MCSAKKEILKQQKHCQMCGTTNGLTIHHQLGHNRVPKHDPRREKIEYLTVICRRCHELYNWAMANFGRRKLMSLIAEDVAEDQEYIRDHDYDGEVWF